MATTTGFYKDNEGTLIDKDSEAALDYLISWSQWLPGGDEISTSNWSVETITGDTDALVSTDTGSTTTTTTITLSGGTQGNIYKVYNTITTTGGLTDRRYFRVKVKARSM
jgi:hypothetical protein